MKTRRVRLVTTTAPERNANVLINNRHRRSVFSVSLHNERGRKTTRHNVDYVPNRFIDFLSKPFIISNKKQY